jgi:hypothetical protein
MLLLYCKRNARRLSGHSRVEAVRRNGRAVKQQVPPLRFALVGMTIYFEGGGPFALVAGGENCRPLGFAPNDTKRRVGFHWGSVAGIPGLKSETWGTLRLLPTQRTD